MKKRVWIIIGSIVAALVVAAVTIILVICLNSDKEEDLQSGDDVSLQSQMNALAEKIKTYASRFKSLNNTQSDVIYNPTDGSVSDKDADGALAHVLYDFDGDSEGEGISFTFKNDIITATPLEFKLGQTIELGSTSLSPIPKLDHFDIIAYAMKIDGKTYIFVETNGGSSLLADGFYHDINRLVFENGSIDYDGFSDYRASAYIESEKNQYLKEVEELGLVATTLDKSFFEQNENAVKLFSIKREAVSNFDVRQLNGTQEALFAKDSFFDFISEKLILDLKPTASPASNSQSNNQSSNNQSSNSQSSSNQSQNSQPSTSNNSQSTPSQKAKFTNAHAGEYHWFSTGDTIEFQLYAENDGSYKYFLSLYPSGAMHATIELWGPWDTSKNEFVLQNENTPAAASYKVKNIDYSSTDKITMDIELLEVADESYRHSVIWTDTYTFTRK